MAKKNYIKIQETDAFPNVIKPKVVRTAPISLDPVFPPHYFKNNQAITLELGCGRGEYTLGLARKYPDRNFIGIDIKTSRLWHGARQALEENIRNVLFVTLKIELINAFFPENTVSEIWLPFPEPKIQRLSGKKCLTSSHFFNMYKKILMPEGLVHVKTDDGPLYEFTRQHAKICDLKVVASADNLYEKKAPDEDAVAIKTRYEKKYLSAEKTIKYLKFLFRH